MAAITMSEVEAPRNGIQFLESVVITNQSTTSAAVTKGLRVPAWANKVIFYIFYNSAAGTSPLFDFTVGVPDFGTVTKLGVPTDDTDATIGNGAWNGITQVTGTGAYQIVVEIGPDVATDDDTGSATASCTYRVQAELPPVITYTYTTDGTTDDEDYNFNIVAHWKA
jgi:hypothetical protein